MVWDRKTPTSITISRLLNLPPAAVYEELRDFGSDEEGLWMGRDHSVEEALLQRNDPLINLGLAQYCASHDVAAALYKRGSLSIGDATYNKALRMAVLGNSLVPRRIMGGNTFGILPDEELLQLINADDKNRTDELYAVLINPGAKRLLDRLYNQEKPFDNVPPDHYIRAVYWSCSNPGIRDDDSNEHGPDLDAYGLQKGVKRLMQVLPVTEDGLRTAYWLLRSTDPHKAGHFDEDPTPLFRRWQPLELSEDFKKYHEGDAHALDMKEEFQCMLGSVYNSYSTKTPDDKLKIVHLGSADSPQLSLRCAYYAREAKLTPEQMEKAYNRDTDAFTLAALYNDRLFWNPKTRAMLERFVRGRLIHRYKRRIAQINKKHPEFDLKPVSAHGAGLLEVDPKQPAEDQKRLERLEAMVATNSKQLNSIYRVLSWVLILVIVAVLLIWRPHF
jgi:hypothetical protein